MTQLPLTRERLKMSSALRVQLCLAQFLNVFIYIRGYSAGPYRAPPRCKTRKDPLTDEASSTDGQESFSSCVLEQPLMWPILGEGLNVGANWKWKKKKKIAPVFGSDFSAH